MKTLLLALVMGVGCLGMGAHSFADDEGAQNMVLAETKTAEGILCEASQDVGAMLANFGLDLGGEADVQANKKDAKAGEATRLSRAIGR